MELIEINKDNIKESMKRGTTKKVSIKNKETESNKIENQPKIRFKVRKIEKYQRKQNILFICSCFKVFKSRENLKLHYKNCHEFIKPYECSICDKKFANRSGKMYHEKTIHKIMKNIYFCKSTLLYIIY